MTSTSDFMSGGGDNISYEGDAIARAGVTGGSIGAYISTSSGSYTTRHSAGSVAYNGYLYVIGGNIRSDVNYAPINSNGTIGTWNTTLTSAASALIPAWQRMVATSTSMVATPVAPVPEVM